VASNTGRVIRARNTIIVDAGGRTVFAVTESRDLEPVPARFISLLLPPSGGKRRDDSRVRSSSCGARPFAFSAHG